MTDVESEIEAYLGSKHVILMPSGRTAIFAALQELLPPDRNEVMLPSLVCETVPSAVQAAGRTPIFIEVGTMK